jgi:hypothetical protein
MLRNPYVQVALTYVHRAFSSLLPSIFAIGILFFVAHATYAALLLSRPMGVNPDDWLRVFMSTLPVWALLPAGIFAMHVKDQFADSRLHLMPHFRRAHIAVAAAATLILAIVVPGLEAWSRGFHSVGTIAITVVLVGAMFWNVLLLSNWMIWPMLAMPLVNLSQTVWRSLGLIVSGQFEVQAVGLLVLGIVIIILAGVRLCRLNEDMPEYHRRMPTGWAAKGRMTGQDVNMDGPWPRAVTEWFRAWAMADLTRHVRLATHSPWSRICRWQLGMPTGWRVWLWAILPVVVLHFLAWQHSSRTPSGAAPMMVTNFLAVLPMIMTVSQSFGWLTLRMRSVDFELMLPVSRRAYVRQWSEAMALGHFQLWGVICVSIMAWLLLAAPVTPPWTYVVSVATVALLIQIGLFGVMGFVWTITTIRAIQIVVFMAIMFGSMTWAFGGCDEIHLKLRPAALPAAAGAAAFGVLLSYLAYRRRLVADFD